MKQQGKVTEFDGFNGTILGDDGVEYYLRDDEVMEGAVVRVNDRVTFVGENHKGFWKAFFIRKIYNGAEDTRAAIIDAINSRHSVRAYTDRAIPEEVRQELDSVCAWINEETGLSFKIVYEDPEGFNSALARYGRFSGVRNYIVLAGPDGPDFDLRCGWYGEMLVLLAQQLGLNTCWTALTFNKKHVKKLVPAGQKLCMAIALGYGQTQGVPHKGKTAQDVMDGALAELLAKDAAPGQALQDEASGRSALPEHFLPAVDAALKAPTAMNQQKFIICMEDTDAGSAGRVRPVVKAKGRGRYVQVDLGIVSYHFCKVAGLARPF